MSRDYWQSKWESNEIAFHRTTPNELLLEYYPLLKLQASQKVLVPLCGKTLDLKWLHEQGLDVVGVEFSPIACEAFFAEHGLEFTQEEVGEHIRYQHPGLTLYAGDLFTLPKACYQDCDAVYDRAALIALDPETRARYTTLFSENLKSGAQILLLTMSYPDEAFQAPPFSVDPAMIADLYQTSFRIENVANNSKDDVSEHLRDKGMSCSTDHIFHLIKNQE